jgi:protease-4
MPALFPAVGSAYRFARSLLLNLLFIALIAAVVALLAAAVAQRPKVPSKAALVLDPRGTIVEEVQARSPRDLLDGAIGGAATQETRLKDMLDALRAAKDDKRIQALYLDLGSLWAAGTTTQREIGRALLDFRKSGKKVVAYADNYAQVRYYLAAHADELYMHPQGGVLIEGLSRFRPYYKQMLDRFSVDVHVFRVGEYKSAVEPYLRSDMSAEARENALALYGDLWRAWLADLATARGLSSDALQAYADEMPERLEAAGGDLGKMALDARLVDKLLTRDQVRDRMIELVGTDEKAHSFHQIRLAPYVRTLGDRSGQGRGDAVAVVVAKGEILDGSQPAGTIGGDSTAALLRKAREDKTVKAVVLRVDSPGGSAFASEIIRRECELVRKAGKPLVVSMGNLAASGGYWISTASDEIWADPTTITGSIGIFGVFPTFDRALARYTGVQVDGTGTTRVARAGVRPDRPLPPEIGRAIQAAINHGYEEFLTRVGNARKMTREQVDAIARGRVWSGEDAKRIGLVDQLGGPTQAVESAAKRAKLAPGYRVLYVERERSLRQRLFEGLSATVAALVGSGDPDRIATTSPLRRALQPIESELGLMARWNDPNGVYAHCLCGEPE